MLPVTEECDGHTGFTRCPCCFHSFCCLFHPYLYMYIVPSFLWHAFMDCCFFSIFFSIKIVEFLRVIYGNFLLLMSFDHHFSVKQTADCDTVEPWITHFSKLLPAQYCNENTSIPLSSYRHFVFPFHQRTQLRAASQFPGRWWWLRVEWSQQSQFTFTSARPVHKFHSLLTASRDWFTGM